MKWLQTCLIFACCLPQTACGQETSEIDSTETYEYSVELGAVDLMDEEADLFGTAFLDEDAAEDIPGRAFLVDFAFGKYWMLWQPLTYTIKDSNISITVPTGFVTDLVSTPRAVWTLIPPTGRYQRAAIIHDWLYWMQPCTRAQSDQILVLAMEELGVERITRIAIYEALERFGEDAWLSNQRDRANGLPRIVPEGMQNGIPDDVDWPQYRTTLAGQGVAPSTISTAAPAYCALGNG